MTKTPRLLSDPATMKDALEEALVSVEEIATDSDACQKPSEDLTTPERNELLELRGRLERAEMERDILKTAAIRWRDGQMQQQFIATRDASKTRAMQPTEERKVTRGREASRTYTTAQLEKLLTQERAAHVRQRIGSAGVGELLAWELVEYLTL